MSLAIEYQGPHISYTNYWKSKLARKGYVFLTYRNDVFYLLVPALRAEWFEEMRTGTEVLISNGAWKTRGMALGVELLFEDLTNQPFSIRIGEEQIGGFNMQDPCLLFKSSGEAAGLSLKVYSDFGEVLELPARYRIVSQIPYLQGWALL